MTSISLVFIVLNCIKVMFYKANITERVFKKLLLCDYLNYTSRLGVINRS